MLGTYEGYPESLDAPQWTKLPVGQPVVFRTSIAAVMDLLKMRGAVPEPATDAVTVRASLDHSAFMRCWY